MYTFSMIYYHDRIKKGTFINIFHRHFLSTQLIDERKMLETIVVVILCAVVMGTGAISWWIDNNDNTNSEDMNE